MKKLITPDEIISGMILAEPIMGNNGQILYALNMKLDAKHSEILKTWGVETLLVYVDDEIMEAGKEETKEERDIRDEAEKLLSKRMKWTPRNNNERDLFEMGIQSISENYF